jgi:hypothetical protein
MTEPEARSERPRRELTEDEIERIIAGALIGGSIPDDPGQPVAIRSADDEARTRARLRKILRGEISLEDAVAEIAAEYSRGDR